MREAFCGDQLDATAAKTGLRSRGAPVPQGLTHDPAIGVGDRYTRWRSAHPLEIHGRSTSNARTLVQRPYTTPTAAKAEGRSPGAPVSQGLTHDPAIGVGVKYTRWRSAHPLEIHGRSTSNARTYVQRPYTTPTAANTKACRGAG